MFRRSILFFASLLLCSGSGANTHEISPVSIRGTTSSNAAQYEARFIDAFHALQTWYDNTTGLWPTAGWWNSANVLTMLVDFDAVNPQLDSTIRQIINNTFVKAPLNKPFLRKQVPPLLPDTITIWPSLPPTQARLGFPSTDAPGSFLNDFYDDEGWWALAWLKAYDVTHDTRFLGAAVDLFEDMVGGYNATCGGIWWNKGHQANVAISNELFLAVAAQLASRAEEADQSKYLDWAVKQWKWFNNSGLIDHDFNIIDGFNLESCKAESSIIWTYTHGVIVGALVDLEALIPGEGFATTAQKIATAGIRYFSEGDGILREPCEPDCGADGPQFKGIFVRNLQKLHQAWPNASYAEFIERNGDSIWMRDRNTTSSRLGLSWAGPYRPTGASAHSSAMDALVAAVLVQSTHRSGNEVTKL